MIIVWNTPQPNNPPQAIFNYFRPVLMWDRPAGSNSTDIVLSGFDFPETNFASLVSVLSLPTNRPTDEVYPPAKVAGRKPAESLAGLGTNKRRAICQNFQTEIRRRKTLLLLLAETGGRHQHSAFHDYMLRTKHCKMMAIAEENRFAYK